jgi:hypothetical protein
MAPIIPCPNLDVLRWFLEHTDFSIVHTSALLSEASFPNELREVVAAEQRVAVDLAIATPADMTALVGQTVALGATAVFSGTNLVGVLPSVVDSPDALGSHLLLSLLPEEKQMKTMGRSALLTLLVRKAVGEPAASKA